MNYLHSLFNKRKRLLKKTLFCLNSFGNVNVLVNLYRFNRVHVLGTNLHLSHVGCNIFQASECVLFLLVQMNNHILIVGVLVKALVFRLELFYHFEIALWVTLQLPVVLNTEWIIKINYFTHFKSHI